MKETKYIKDYFWVDYLSRIGYLMRSGKLSVSLPVEE